MMPLLVIGGVVAAYFVWKNSTPSTPAAPPASSGSGSGSDDTSDLTGDAQDLINTIF